ncbi:hypothetical protein chiPu_0027032 [Chiloscyllium punctatum]|uniref:Uncharacterized protein n=1 Tax=Chiloscyllium punctatum TaxID=137246 RepID=A0A401TKD4_CHIPU|nr:hypothetical protein [Chiloscyllium punctatum]
MVPPRPCLCGAPPPTLAACRHLGAGHAFSVAPNAAPPSWCGARPPPTALEGDGGHLCEWRARFRFVTPLPAAILVRGATPLCSTLRRHDRRHLGAGKGLARSGPIAE